MTDRECRDYLAKLVVGLVIVILLTHFVLEAAPFGDWTTLVLALLLPLIGLGVALYEGW